MKRLALTLCVLLAGCDGLFSPPPPPPTSANLTLPAPGEGNSINISEFCYKGITYILNNKGGMAPLILPATGQPKLCK